MKINLKNLLYYFILVVLIFPRSFDVLLPDVYVVINALKVISFFVLLFLLLKNKVRFSKFTKIVIGFFGYVFLVTCLNGLSPITFLKTYPFNIAILFWCELIFNDKKKDFYLEKVAKIFVFLLFVNLFCMLGCKFLTGEYYFKTTFTYFLGQDNRFILYILPPILCYNYLFNKDKKYKISLLITYLLSLFMLTIVWSVSAMLVLFALLFLNLIFMKKKKKNIKLNINLNFFTALLVVLSVLIVFFRIQNLFKFFIVDILHKSLTLSYRTNIWDIAINIFKEDTFSLIIGHGFYDIRDTFAHIVTNASGVRILMRPNHLHNLLMNSLYFYGIIGTCFYSLIYTNIIKKINMLKDNLYMKKVLSVIFLSILVLLIFDTFDLYSLYYMILYFLFGLAEEIKATTDMKEFESGFQKFKKKEQEDSIGVMMATYNGERYLKEQIDSILNQSYGNWILYISDDQSNDETVKIINSYVKKYHDKIILLNNDHKFRNARDNFNNVLTQVGNHDYYMFTDQDDVWQEDKMYKLLYFIKKKEELSKTPILVYSDVAIVDSKLNILKDSLIKDTGKYLPQKNLLNHVLVQNYFPGCAVLFNNSLKQVLDNIYKESEMHDWWLTLVAAYTGKIYFLNLSLHYYRQHESNVIGAGQHNDFFDKYKERFRKLFSKNASFTNWKEYQQLVVKQAKELKQRYSYLDNQVNEQIVNKFIQTMETKNKFYKFCKLFYYHFTNSEAIRTLRLI